MDIILNLRFFSPFLSHTHTIFLVLDKRIYTIARALLRRGACSDAQALQEKQARKAAAKASGVVEEVRGKGGGSYTNAQHTVSTPAFALERTLLECSAHPITHDRRRRMSTVVPLDTIGTFLFFL